MGRDFTAIIGASVRSRSTVRRAEMLRGVQKKIIFVNMADSKTFESAYFIMRDGGKGAAECDMVKEATRIVSGALPGKEDRRRGWQRFLVLFAAVLLSAILGRLSWFLF